MPEQLKMVSLKCASCGGALEIYGDMERFACGYCGSEQVVERRGGTVGLRLVVDAVARVQVGTDKTAAELALVRLDKELATAQARWDTEDAEFRRRNKSNSATTPFLIVISIIIFMFALRTLFSGVGVGSLLASVVFGGIATVIFILALKANKNAEKRYKTRRSEIWEPHAKHIIELEKQIAKQRRLIHS